MKQDNEPNNIPAIYPSAPSQPIEVQIGLGLLSLIAAPQEELLLKRLDLLRSKLLDERGIILPGVHFKDNISIPRSCYEIQVQGMTEAAGELRLDSIFVMGNQEHLAHIPGEEGREPLFGLEGKWAPINAMQEVDIQKCAVLEPLSILLTHLGEVIKRVAYELIGVEEVAWMLEHMLPQQKLRKAVMRAPGGIRSYKGVLKSLLMEQVSLVSFEKITKAYLLALRQKQTPVLESLRTNLGEHIVSPFTEKDGVLNAMLLAPESEAVLINRYLKYGVHAKKLLLSPEDENILITSFRQWERKAYELNIPGVVLVTSQLRAPLATILRRGFVNLTILKLEEVPQTDEIVSSRILTLPTPFNIKQEGALPANIKELWKAVSA